MTRWRRFLAPTAVAMVLVSCCTGCALAACTGPENMGPAVWLDASPWLAAHPDKSLVACFAGQCQKLGAQQAIGELVQGNGDLGKPQPLTVSTAGDFPKPVFSTRATLKDVVVHGACGDVNLWGLNARVNADGQVAILGWSGSSLRPATTVPSPTTTPAFGR